MREEREGRKVMLTCGLWCDGRLDAIVIGRVKILGICGLMLLCHHYPLQDGTEGLLDQ